MYDVIPDFFVANRKCEAFNIFSSLDRHDTHRHLSSGVAYFMYRNVKHLTLSSNTSMWYYIFLFFHQILFSLSKTFKIRKNVQPHGIPSKKHLHSPFNKSRFQHRKRPSQPSPRTHRRDPETLLCGNKTPSKPHPSPFSRAPGQKRPLDPARLTTPEPQRHQDILLPVDILPLPRSQQALPHVLPQPRSHRPNPICLLRDRPSKRRPSQLRRTQPSTPLDLPRYLFRHHSRALQGHVPSAKRMPSSPPYLRKRRRTSSVPPITFLPRA